MDYQSMKEFLTERMNTTLKELNSVGAKRITMDVVRKNFGIMINYFELLREEQADGQSKD